MLLQLIKYVMLDYRQKWNCIVWFINPPRFQWVPWCLNTGLESSSCLSVSLEQLNKYICFSWTDQTIETDSRLELWLRLVLSFVNLATLERLGWNNTQLLHFHFLVLVPNYWHEDQAEMCIGNNARGLSTPLLLCSRWGDNHTLQSLGHCSAWCAQLGSACLGSFLESERLLYLLAPNPHLDHVFICIFYASLHATPTWISHWAHQGFLHGNSSHFGFCISRDDTHAFRIFIYQAQSFLIELVIWLVHQILSSLS